MGASTDPRLFVVGAGTDPRLFVIDVKTVFTGVAFRVLDFRSIFGGDPGRTPSDCTYKAKIKLN